jgi:hypothetical protein
LQGRSVKTGELLVEGVGAMELEAKESGGLRRMDVREAGAITRSLSRYPLQAAFRYNRRGADDPKLQLEWRQFLDADVSIGSRRACHSYDAHDHRRKIAD